MKVVGYCRVSKKEQSINCHALEQQINRVQKSGAEIIYQDIESGRSSKRKKFNLLVEEIKQGQIQKVIATRLDRLTRELKTQIEFIELINKHNVILYILDQDIDTSTASGKLHLNLLGAVAQNESDQLSERINHGFNYLRSRNIPLSAPYGYEIQGNQLVLSKRVILHEVATKTEYSKYKLARWLIENLLSTDCSFYSLAQKFNTKFGFNEAKSSNGQNKLSLTATGIKRWLNNPVIRGHLVYKKPTYQIIYNTHEPLLTEKEYQLIQQRLKINNPIRKHRETKHLFSGLIYCSGCDRRLTICSQPIRQDYKVIDKTYYYRCRHYWEGKCDCKRAIKESEVRKFVVQELRLKAQDIINFAHHQETKTINPKISELESQILTLKQMPSSEILLEAISKLEREVESLKQVDEVSGEIDSEKIDLLLRIYQSSGFWDSLPKQAEKEIYRQLISKISTDGYKLEIEFNF